MARNATSTATKPARPVGPKMVYLVFRPDTPADLKATIETYLVEVTSNSRMLVRAVTGGEGMGPVIVRKLEAETRGPRATKSDAVEAA